MAKWVKWNILVEHDRRGSRGGEMGEFSPPPPPPFLRPFFLSFFSYPSNIEIVFDFSDVITKIHPPISKSWIRPCAHEAVFLLLSLLWGLCEDVLYLDNYAMLFCFFKYWYVCVLHSIFFEIFVSEVRYFIHQIVVVVQYMAFAFAQKLSARPRKADKGHRSLSEAIWLWETK